MKRYLLALLGLGVFAAPAAAQEPAASPSPAPQEQAPEDETIKREEVVVVTASRVESTMINAPATMTVVTSEVLNTTPAQNYGDLLRAVPGMNVVQTSARDINIVSRQSTGTLSASQLTLLDGRSIYLDFFGMVLWDFVPTNTSDIKQIEVVRGPASAVWGANALTGVVNIITKSPRESQGFTAILNGGYFDRDVGSTAGEDSGNTYAATLGWAAAPNDNWSYKLTAGYYHSDPYARPVGTVPLDTHPLDSSIITGGALYPADRDAARPGEQVFNNTETDQPKVDLRVDQDMTNGARITYTAGYAGTEGIIHTGIGPFRIQSGSYMGYGRIAFSKGALRIAAFANLVDAEAPNLLLVDPATNLPVQLNFKTQTFDLEVGALDGAGRQARAELRRQRAAQQLRHHPDAQRRGPQRVRRLPAGRDLLRQVALRHRRPRGQVRQHRRPGVLAPRHGHVQARPAALDPRLLQPGLPLAVGREQLPRPAIVVLTHDLSPLRPFLPPSLQPFATRLPAGGSQHRQPRGGRRRPRPDRGVGHRLRARPTPALRRRTTVGFAVYQNDQDDNINFMQPRRTMPGYVPYTVTDPPPPAGGRHHPARLHRHPGRHRRRSWAVPSSSPRSAATYLNLGPIRQRGVEVSLDHSFNEPADRLRELLVAGRAGDPR